MLLDFQETKRLLSKYKIPGVKSKLVKNKAEVFRFSERNGYPLVLKVSSPGIIHKTDINGVILDIRDRKVLSAAWLKISKLSKREKANIIIQKQERGKEIIIGAKRDATFGPVVMFGLGGIFTEILKDVSLRLVPISRGEAGKMVKEIRGYKLLAGLRGEKAVNIEAIKDILIGISRMIEGENNIKGVDLNPVIADTKKAVAVDAKIVL